ncbi:MULTISPECIES: peptide chain release factor N(5)-glutamine methyltransferase [unclassified Corynebacterium]|uniref:peptide chain release factor N(5)-glutamine methyltransferase n=1 Tax=unclassified Corynebacterium TaxID=2624378 RepID=UPI0029C9DB86|nr:MULTISPECIES: peptide chain release factor N(5)-glutamine methyltransferase [unclassified Corynebacterium]WPF67009.1 peptide chain release factor N(5)-glutamine methyltransferase [Corynebacterium sp. 22KM0430]WPF69497.1 peptide chain release factor N(5)-glutamine methyltransferase [Corynebacterium sp. 21KM1197]
MTLRAELARASAELARAGVPSPEVDAREIAAHLLGCSLLEVGWREATLPPEYGDLVRRRARREPLQYILGRAPFGPLTLAVGPGVFIPRPETEVLADWAVGALRGVDKPLVVDLCTGSGALAAYIAHARADAQVVAVERSPKAAAWARRNLEPLGVELREGDATDLRVVADLVGRASVVVSNPPYVPEADDLPAEVYHDPHEAVFAGADGMSVINRLVEPAAALLAPGGYLGIEHDDATARDVARVVSRCPGLSAPVAVRDLSGRERFVTASKLSN